MSNYAKCQLIGRLTKEPDTKSTKSGINFCRFSIAVNQGQNENKKTSFFNIVAWKKQAEIITQYVHKGHLIFIEAEPYQNSWKDQSGENKSTIEFRLLSFQFLPNKTDHVQYNDVGGLPMGATEEYKTEEVFDDEMPF